MNALPTNVYVKDVSGNYRYINRKCEELLGVKREELGQKDFTDFDFFDPVSAKQVRENDKYVMRTGQNIETEEVGVGLRYYLSLRFPLLDRRGVRLECAATHMTLRNANGGESKFSRKAKKPSVQY
jgi:PAS domain S-box-containing protein